MSPKYEKYAKNIIYKGSITGMGLSLNNIYQRPYVNQERKGSVLRREEDEKSTRNATQEDIDRYFG